MVLRWKIGDVVNKNYQYFVISVKLQMTKKPHIKEDRDHISTFYILLRTNNQQYDQAMQKYTKNEIHYKVN